MTNTKNSKRIKMSKIKEEARKLLKNLPDDVTWDDIMYEIYVRKKISKGLDAIEEDKLLSHDEVKERIRNKWK